MKILRPQSVLHILPVDLGNKELMLLDSIRFTTEIIDYNYEQLILSLENISLDNEKKIHFKVFSAAWSIVDHVARLIKLHSLLNGYDQTKIDKLNYVDEFRNAIQHVDINLERTNVKMLDNGRPIYGALKWIVSDKKHNKVYTSMMISGIFNIKNINFRQHAPAGHDELISHILLETDTLKKSSNNEINLSNVRMQLGEVIAHLENQLIKQVKRNNWKLANWDSLRDVILNMHNR